MPAPAQEAFAEGFADLLEVHGQTCTFGASEFAGVFSPLKPDDPRLLGTTDRLLELQVATADLPATAPKRGEEITVGALKYRVTRYDTDRNTGVTTFLVTQDA